MAGEYINSKAGKKRIKKQWKSKERKDELHTFKDTTAAGQTCGVFHRLETMKNVAVCCTSIWNVQSRVWLNQEKQTNFFAIFKYFLLFYLFVINFIYIFVPYLCYNLLYVTYYIYLFII